MHQAMNVLIDLSIALTELILLMHPDEISRLNTTNNGQNHHGEHKLICDHGPYGQARSDIARYCRHAPQRPILIRKFHSSPVLRFTFRAPLVNCDDDRRSFIHRSHTGIDTPSRSPRPFRRANELFPRPNGQELIRSPVKQADRLQMAYAARTSASRCRVGNGERLTCGGH